MSTSAKSTAITLHDVAAHLGMSHMSVSRALRGAKGVSAATIARVQAAVLELGYNPQANHAARRMVLSRYGREPVNHLVAVIFPQDLPTSPYFIQMFLGAVDELERHEFGVITHYNTPSHDQRFMPVFTQGMVDGMIILPSTASRDVPPFIQRLRAETPFAARPIVSLISPIPECVAVLADDYGGGYAAATHLLDLGHRALLHFTFGHYIYQQRLQGYQQACREHGLDPEACLRHTPWINESPQTPEADLLDTLRRMPDITGILAPNDYIALRIYQTITGLGRRIPDDYSLIGYDDALPSEGPCQDPPLTTVHLPLEELGRAAARVLLRRIEGEGEEDGQQCLPTYLVVRATTAVNNTEDSKS